ncbi:MAG TPA: WYL domain-containing protein [Solirubrobacteraceae bacterium]|nr:WYL domain-containing protein [Solirubrobacteraceae bacterium]
MIETSARLLALLSLLQMRREWTGAELASRLEVDVRTVRRDIDKLRSLGYPIESARGVAGGYRLGAGGELPPLLLDDAEAVAVAVGLRTAASGSVTGIEEASVRALGKLEQLLPSRLRRRVRALGDATSAFTFQTERIDADLLADVAAACRDTMQVRFSYRTRDERAGERHAEPAAVVYSGSRWYLLAWDLEREDWRTFRVDRIRGRLRPAGRGRHRPIPGGDAAAYVRGRLQSAGERIAGEDSPPGRVRVHAPAGRLRGRIPARWATVEPDGEDASVITSRGPWRRDFLVWMATLGESFEVLDPPALRDAGRELAERLAESTAEGGRPHNRSHRHRNEHRR